MWLARLLRALPFFLQTHMENPRAQTASGHEGRGICPILAGAPSECSRKMPNCSPIAETICEEDMLEEEPTVDQELRLWDSRLLKVIFVM